MSVWRLSLARDVPGVPHVLDKEEIFVVLSGQGEATLGDDRFEIHAGDALVVPSNQLFSLRNSGAHAFEAIAVAAAGVRAHMTNGESFAPPWTL